VNGYAASAMDDDLWPEVPILLGLIAVIALLFHRGNWILGTLLLGGVLWLALRLSRPKGPPRRGGNP
jgi:hypothetical protein